MKMQKLVDASPAIRKLAGKELPLKAAYDISRLIKKLDEHLSFHDEKWQEMLAAHCEEKEGRWYPKNEEERTALDRERRELLELDVEIGEMRPVVLAGETEVSLSAADLMALEGFIEIHFEEEK